GTALQRQRAIWLSRQVGNIEVLPQLTIQKAAEMIYGARAVVAVDTGFAHLAAALEKPIVALFGATDAKKTGILGNQAVVLQSTISCSPCLKRNCPMPKKIIYPPCYQSLTPENVLQYLESMACLDD